MILLFSIIGVDSDITNINLIRFFCRFYSSMDLDDHHIIFHTSGDKEGSLDKAGEVLREFGLRKSLVWRGDYTPHTAHKYMLSLLCRLAPEDWVIPADVDEFVEFPSPPRTFLRESVMQGFNCIKGRLVDRVAADGELRAITREPSLEDQFPYRSDLTASEAGGNTGKIVAFHPRLIPGRGHHAIIRRRSKARYHNQVLQVNHYKWDSLLRLRMGKRIKEYKKRGIPWAKESQRLQSYFAIYPRIRAGNILGPVLPSEGEGKGT